MRVSHPGSRRRSGRLGGSKGALCKLLVLPLRPQLLQSRPPPAPGLILALLPALLTLQSRRR